MNDRYRVLLFSFILFFPVYRACFCTGKETPYSGRKKLFKSKAILT